MLWSSACKLQYSLIFGSSFMLMIFSWQSSRDFISITCFMVANSPTEQDSPSVIILARDFWVIHLGIALGRTSKLTFNSDPKWFDVSLTHSGQRALLLAEAAGMSALGHVSCCRRDASARVNRCKSAPLLWALAFSHVWQCSCCYTVGEFC